MSEDHFYLYSVDPDEMQPYAAFHLGLHCLQKYLFFGVFFIGFFTSQSTIFQLFWNGSSLVEPVLSKD